MTNLPLAHQADLANYIPLLLGQAAKGAVPVYVGPGKGFNGGPWTTITPPTDGWALFSSTAQGQAASYSPGAFGGGIVDGSVDKAHRKITAQPRSIAWAPTGAVAETFSRSRKHSSLVALSSSQLSAFGGLELRRGAAVNNIVVMAATAAGSPGNQWACLIDQAGLVVAVSSDLTTTAWAAGTKQTFPLATPYTPGADVSLYLGLMVACAGSPPNLYADTGAIVYGGIAPITCATAGTGFTTPIAVGTALTLAASNISSVYGYLT